MTANAPFRPAHVPIESLRVGQRVLTGGNVSELHETAVDPKKWRHLRLEAILPWADGTQDLIEVESLQPPEWVSAHGAEIGATVPMPLDLTEMGLPTDLPTRVVTNEPCPRVQVGPGRLVTSTISHLHPQVVELSLRNYDGREETVRPSAPHKFYSDSRGTWVSAADLRAGERLRGIGGPVMVASLKPVPGVHRVYNMSIETEHVYRVSNLGVLVHNPNCAGSPNSSIPLNERGNLPASGPPNSSQYVDYGNGNGTIRDYGPGGNAATDYDFGHNHGAGDPHAHDWNWQNVPARGPERPLQPGE